MKPAIEKQLKTQIPTPLFGTYTVRLLAVDPENVYAVIEHGKSFRTTILPAQVSRDWMKTMRDQYAVVKFRTMKTQTEIIIQDRVGYIDGKRVYINSRAETLPQVLVEH
jgi:hypothetical protein